MYVAHGLCDTCECDTHPKLAWIIAKHCKCATEAVFYVYTHTM